MSTTKRETGTISSTRGKEWIYSALWTSCEDPRVPKSLIKVPLTFLFRKGLPTKVVTNNDQTGTVKRVNLSGIETHPDDKRTQKEYDIKNLALIRKLLLEYAYQTAYYDSQLNRGIEEPMIVSVVYLDGQSEDLTLFAYDELIRRETWRYQLLLVQGYIPVMSVQSGYYEVVTKVRSRLDEQGAEAADKLTAALAKYAENAFKVNKEALLSCGLGEKDGTIDSPKKNAAKKKLSIQKERLEIKLTVIEMRGTFVLDPFDKVVFLYSDYVTIQVEKLIPNPSIDPNNNTIQSNEDNVLAGKRITNNLLKMLSDAREQGLSGQESFAHFDISGSGFVDADIMIDGLARLGIGVTYPVAEEIIQNIGGFGSELLSFQDFTRFLSNPIDLEIFDMNNDPSDENIIDKNNKKKKKMRMKSQLLPPPKLDNFSKSFDSIYSFKKPLPSINKDGDFNTDGMSMEESQYLSWQNQAAENSFHQHHSTLEDNDLPAPVSAYTIHIPEGDHSLKLPEWTSNRNKNALKEIKTQHKEWTETQKIKENKANGISTPKPKSRLNSRAKDKKDLAKMNMKLNLESIARPSTADIHPDEEIFEIEIGLTMTFRILFGEGDKEDRYTHEKMDIIRYRSVLQERQRNMEGFIKEKQDKIDEAERLIEEERLRVIEEKRKSDEAYALKYKRRAGRIGGRMTKEEKKEMQARGMIPASGSQATPVSSMPSTPVAGYNPVNPFGDTSPSNSPSKSPSNGSPTNINPSSPGSPTDGTFKNTTGSLHNTNTFNNTYGSFANTNGSINGHSTTNGSTNGFNDTNQTDEEGKKLDRWLSFTLIVVPDLFMTLDTLQKYLQQILVKYPLARLILIGLTGLPNTSWPLDWTLNPDLHAMSIAKLITHLKKSNRLSPLRGEPIFLMGVGSGSYPLTKFTTLYIPKWMNERVKVVSIVNGFLNISKSYRRSCKDARIAMQSAIPHEVNELLIGLHFSDEYLDLNGRANSLKEFWSTRRTLHHATTSESKAGYTGVLSLINGVLQVTTPPDEFDGTDLFKTKLPLVVVQSTEDMFVNPRNASIFQKDKLPKNRNLVTDVSDALDSDAVYVCWLKAGHEVLQERTHFILGLISNFAQMCGIHPADEGPEEVEVEEDEAVFDVLLLAANRRKQKADELQAAEDAIKKKEEDRKAEKRERQAERQRKLDLIEAEEAKKREFALLSESDKQKQLDIEAEMKLELQKENDAAALLEQQADDLIEAEKKRTRNAIEKAKRNKIAEDRRKRDEIAKRKDLMEDLYQRMREEAEIIAERKENIKMLKEDGRSRHADDYADYLELIESGRPRAIDRKKELDVARREEAIKRVEDNMARKRQDRLRERKIQAEKVSNQMLAEAAILEFEGEKESTGYKRDESDFDIPGSMIAAAHRIMKDLLYVRQQSVESLKRQLLVQEKMDLFMQQIDAIQHEIRTFRLSLRPLIFERSLLDPRSKEYDELSVSIEKVNRNLAVKEETFMELAGLVNSREAQLSAANRSLQIRKIASRTRDQIMRDAIDEMKELANKYQKDTKVTKHLLHVLKLNLEKLRVKIILLNVRVTAIKKELRRLKYHDHEFIDSDVWMPGVMQRNKTVELKKHLNEEVEREIAKIQIVTDEKELLIFEINEVNEKLSRYMRDCDKMTIAEKSFSRIYQKFSAVSVVDIMHNLKEKQEEAAAAARKKLDEEHDASMKASGDIVSFDLANPTILALRKKDPDLRTQDERKFVGIDIIMNPEAYSNISIVEAEQMQFDEDYQCELPKDHLIRIERLPPEICLALPFLSNPYEINIHRLINLFKRGIDDGSQRNDDYTNECTTMDKELADVAIRKFNDSVMHPGCTTVKEVQESDVIEAILVKETLRDRIRSTGEGEEMTDSEREWLQMDKILSPHVFDISEIGELDELNTQARYAARFQSSVIHANEIDRVTRANPDSVIYEKQHERFKPHPSRDGDQYQRMRWRYDNGEVVFDYSWRCPFDKAQLLTIHNTPSALLNSDDARKAKLLLDKYYVSDDDSTLGRARLATMKEMVKEIEDVLDGTWAIEKARREKVLKRLSDQYNWRPGDKPIPTEEEEEQEEKEKEEKELAEKQEKERLEEVERLEELAELKKNKGKKKAKPKKVDSPVKVEKTDEDEEKDPYKRKKKKKKKVEEVVEVIIEPEPEPIFVETEETIKEKELLIKREWGGWETVHPASAGIKSQTKLFLQTTFNVESYHPGAYGKLPEVVVLDPTDAANMDLFKNKKDKEELDPHKNDIRSKYYICDTVKELAMVEPQRLYNKIALLADHEPVTFLTVTNAILKTRQTRSHRFTIPDSDDLRVLDIIVNITFDGTTRKLGRLAAKMYMLPTEGDPDSSPIPIPTGYSPYPLQAPHLPDFPGKICIMHKPKSRPIKPSTFQIVICSASPTRYQIEVVCKKARAALPIIDEDIEIAKRMQTRLPICVEELVRLSESCRMAERKLLVCEKMIKEAQNEILRCKRMCAIISEDIDIDTEEMIFLEDERIHVLRELSIYEVEQAQWSAIFEQRCQERLDIKEGIFMMFEFQRRRQQEKIQIKASLAEARRYLPACVGSLRSFKYASEVAIQLNTVVGHGAGGDDGGQVQEIGIPKLSTPAEDLRKRMKIDGISGLSIEEQQWHLLDLALNPQLYEYLKEIEEEENAKRIAIGQPIQVTRYSLAVEKFRYSRNAIEHILATPFSMLTRKEVEVRKLLVKFHDDIELIKKNFASAAYGYDANSAERIRAKNMNAWTKQEKEWAAIDKILHREIWDFYVHEEKNIKNRALTESLRSGTQLLEAIDNYAMSKKPKKNRFQNDENMTEQEKLLNILNVNHLVDSSDSSLVSSQVISRKSSVLEVDSEDENSINSSTASSAGITNVNIDFQLMDRNSKRLTEMRKTIYVEPPPWICTWDKKEILRVWSAPTIHDLKTDDERTCYKLLNKFSGTYSSYVEGLHQAKIRKHNAVRPGAHIQFTVGKDKREISTDIDLRSRQIIHEIDRCVQSESQWMNSDVLHGHTERFPKMVLRMHLEQALDDLLRDQIIDRERSVRAAKHFDDLEVNKDDEHKVITQEDIQKEKLELISCQVNDGSVENEEDQVITNEVYKRSKIRAARKVAVKRFNAEKEVLKARKMVSLMNKKGPELEAAVLQNKLGAGGCIACRKKKCLWKPFCEVAELTKRKKIVERELERVKLNRDTAVFESTIAHSATLGGVTHFSRGDLLHELTTEAAELHRRLHLNDVDKELHDVCATRKEYFEVRSLHGYSVMLWKSNAKAALLREQSSLVAVEVSRDVVEDILSWMLDGWYFGEVKNTEALIQQQILDSQKVFTPTKASVMKLNEAGNSKKGKLSLDSDTPAVEEEEVVEAKKTDLIELSRLKVARDGNHHEKKLNETESNLRFGLFMLCIMYFRSIVYLRKKFKQDGKEEETVNVLTKDDLDRMEAEKKEAIRRKKINILLSRSKIGDARRINREKEERSDGIHLLQVLVRRQNLEVNSVVCLQRVYRGHIHRKAGKRWALKRYELMGMHYLLSSCAVMIQRSFRGFRARNFAIRKRVDMAQIIALMRAQEAAADEDVYWETHPWQKFKRNHKELFDLGRRKDHKVDVVGQAMLDEEDEQQRIADSLASLQNDSEEEEEEEEDDDDEEEEDDEDDDDDDVKK